MTGIIIAAHGSLGKAFIDSASLIYGESADVQALGLFHGDNAEEFRKKILKAIEKEKEKDGIIIFTDIAGGTPYNEVLRIIYEYKHRKKITCFTGVNLPLFLETLSSRDLFSHEELVEELNKAAKDSIYNINDKILF